VNLSECLINQIPALFKTQNIPCISYYIFSLLIIVHIQNSIIPIDTNLSLDCISLQMLMDLQQDLLRGTIIELIEAELGIYVP
jgi:hypothetical protein